MSSSRLKTLTTIVVAAFVACAALAHAQPAAGPDAGPRLVRVSLGSVPARLLMREGFDVLRLEGDAALLFEWPGDAGRLAALGLTAEVLDPAPGRTAAARARAELDAAPAPVSKRVASAARADGRTRIESLPPFGSGSLGGYWTLAEVKMKLDDLVASDVHGVVADRLDTLGTTWAGRPVWGLSLGKASSPVVFMNALTHAREPGSMQTLFYFVDDLLAGYGVDPFATYLLDHRRIYVVPVVNPDGYAVNESLYVASGGTVFGMWRKNVRDNNGSMGFEDSDDGVDINRNYGYRWGKDNSGSSPTPSSTVYRGPSPFSEPETQAQRDIVAALAPGTALSFHSWGDLHLHPWGHSDSLVAHVDAYREWSDGMARNTFHETGSLIEVLYDSNGDFSDWAYGDTLTKPRTFSWITEVGTIDDGFWPPPSRITPIAAENLRGAYVAAAIAGPWLQAERVTIEEGALAASYGAHVRVRARNLGLATAPAGLNATLVPLDPGVTMLVPTVSVPALGSRQSGEMAAPFELVVHDTVTAGRPLRFAVDFTAAGGYFSRDTVVVPLGAPTELAADDANAGLGLWSPGAWGIVAGEPAHPGPFFADSPGGKYGFAANNAMRLLATLDLSAGVHAWATFDARWDFEAYYDAGMIEVSTDGSTWTPVTATGSAPGSGLGVQAAGMPYFGGTQWGWTRQLVDLSAYAGLPSVQLRFRVRDNGNGTQKDGFNFDSLRVMVFDPAAQPPLVAAGDPPSVRRLALGVPSPNPVRGTARFEASLPRAGRASLEILDLQGRRVRRIGGGVLDAGRHTLAWDGRDAAGRTAAAGVYLARLALDDEARTVRFAVVR